MKRIFGLGLLVMGLAGCSSIVDGTSQELMVNTNPSGADCELIREGNSIARINPTPGAATIQKTKHDITVVCRKEGYQEAKYLNNSGVAGATFGNIILGGGVGWAIDSASGADNKYESPMNISLVPTQSESQAQSGAGGPETETKATSEDRTSALTN